VSSPWASWASQPTGWISRVKYPKRIRQNFVIYPQKSESFAPALLYWWIVTKIHSSSRRENVDKYHPMRGELMSYYKKHTWDRVT
jgi:hypothetical protein